MHRADAVRQRPVPGEGVVELTGASAVLREATLVAIDEAGERLSLLCTALLRGHAADADAIAQADAVRSLLELLGEMPRADDRPHRSSQRARRPGRAGPPQPPPRECST
jgi:hypothetical protein